MIEPTVYHECLCCGIDMLLTSTHLKVEIYALKDMGNL